MRLHPDALSASTPNAIPSPKDHANYRQAMASFGTGVTVVTTHWQDFDWGMTCNSFSSVSLEPRLVLWSIRREASSYEAFTRSGGFTVNVLSHPQQHLARQFATGSQEQRFSGVPQEHLSSQGICLQGAAAWFECELHQLVEAGDHTIILGRVVRYASQDAPALSFWRSRFGRFGSDA
ncbi:MAG: flavin reductase family protein [Burkholderiales bacterium]|nr:flavin reductase family protein [Burkholderiales bacterium]